MDHSKTCLAGLAPRRKAAGYTQAGLAVALDVSRSLLAAWEVGQVWPSAQRLPRIAQLLGCTIEELYEPPANDKRAVEDAGPYKEPEARADESGGPYGNSLSEGGGEHHAGELPEHLPGRQENCRSDAGALG